MEDLFGVPGLCETSPKRPRHIPPTTVIEIRCKAMDKVVLPACAQNRISIAGLAQLKLDEAVQDRLAFVQARRMATTTRGDDQQEEKDTTQGLHGHHQRKKWTRMEGDCAGIG